MAFLRKRRVIRVFTVPAVQPLASPTCAMTPSGVSGPQRHSASMIWLSAPEILIGGRMVHPYRKYTCIFRQNTSVCWSAGRTGHPQEASRGLLATLADPRGAD